MRAVIVPLLPLFLALAACGFRDERFAGNGITVASAEVANSAVAFPEQVAVCFGKRDKRMTVHVTVRIPQRCDLKGTLVDSRFGASLVLDPGQICTLPLAGALVPMRIREGSGTMLIGDSGNARQIQVDTVVQHLDLAMSADTLDASPRFVAYRFSGAGKGEAHDTMCAGG